MYVCDVYYRTIMNQVIGAFLYLAACSSSSDESPRSLGPASLNSYIVEAPKHMLAFTVYVV